MAKLRALYDTLAYVGYVGNVSGTSDICKRTFRHIIYIVWTFVTIIALWDMKSSKKGWRKAVLVFATLQYVPEIFALRNIVREFLLNVCILPYNQQNVGDLSHSFKFFPRFYPPKYPSKLFDTLQNCLACFWNFRTP